VTDASYLVVAGVVGACIGSFLNVVVWRLPRGESLSRPPSRCPGCGARIRWFDNVPILSWLLLRGRCRRCKGSISARYPLVEALTAALFVLVALRHGPDEAALAATKAAALAALLAIAAIDAEHRIIPDAITKPGIAVALLLALLVPGLHDAGFLRGAKPGLSRLLEAAAGAAVGWLVILAIRWTASKLLKKEAMGLGDAKLLAFVGALTNPLAVLYTLLLGSVVGAVVGSVWLLVRLRSLAPVSGTVTPEGGDPVAFRRARVEDEHLSLELPEAPAPGTRVRVAFTLRADDLFEDVDAKMNLAGAVEASRGALVPVRLDSVGEADAERLRTFALVRRYIPFGPFLALAGAVMLLYGDEVVRFVTETWPSWVMGAPPDP
jgi:leader peptidase (prepilin peptidase)/N-methyltransferase